MDERKDRFTASGSNENLRGERVRIIGPEEAQAALDSGEAAGRRKGQGQPRYGDVPPSPSGPRPAHRFPLPHAVDQAEGIARPPVVPRPGDTHAADTQAIQYSTKYPTGHLTQPDDRAGDDRAGDDRAGDDRAGDEGVGDSGVGDRTIELAAGRAERSRFGADALYDEPTAASSSPPPPRPPEEGITVDSGEIELPHWTDPPTGEVPRVLREARSAHEDDDDLAAWTALGAQGVRWRDGAEDWQDVEEIGELAGDEEPSGILDPSRSEESDLFSFDEDFEAAEARRTGSLEASDDADLDYEDEELFSPRPAAPRSHMRSARTRTRSGSGRRVGRPTTTDASPPAGGSLGGRVAVGAGLIVLLAIAYAIGSKALLVLSAAVIVASAAEAYNMVQRSGFRPATLLGLVGAAGVVLGAYWRGTEAIALAVVLVFAGSMAWYLLRIVDARPLANVSVTTMIFCWTGVLGSFAGVMLRAHQGKGLFLGTVIVAVAVDVVAFAVGRWIGSRQLAGSVSPGKTLEGFLGGWAAAVVAGAIVGKEVAPWGGMKHGLLLGLVLGLVTPAGDLFESMVKRDLGLKDSGSVLAGHGGLLDRFDGVLLALPFACGLAWLVGILK